MRHRVSTPKTGPRHRASHRDAAQPGDGAASPRAHRNDGAEGEGAAAVRRADDHASPSAGSPAGDANGKSLHARRLVLRDIQDRDVVGKLFDTIAPRFEARPGGYTRILRLGFRRGDSAEVAQIELVGSEFNPNAEAEKTEAAAKAKPKGVGGRLRAAAERLRGKKAKPKKAATSQPRTRPSRSAS